MRIYGDFPRLFSATVTALASATALATLVACSDSSGPSANTSPNLDVPPEGVTVLSWSVADSLKNPLIALSSSSMSSSAIMPSKPALSLSIAAAEASALAIPSYTVSTVPFAPEAAPTVSAGPNCDDCLWVNNPIGFTFAFFGRSYDKINIGSNGLVGFGVNTMQDGCCRGDLIPLNNVNNNIIALGQTDWMPNAVQRAIRYETRGFAPNRRFVLQFTNVPEFAGNGRLTVQLVLSEGSNQITIFTTSLVSTVTPRVLTQGIENLVGNEAFFIPGRVQKFFSLTNDAIRFSPVNPNQVPAVVAPANISVNTAAGACAAAVNPGLATASDDAPGVILASARSDKLALDALYPKGVTTITWTATDVEGLTASAAQTVTVTDAEKPTISAPANVMVDNDRGLSTAAVAAGTPTTTDNCPDVGVVGSRNDFLTLGEPYRIGVTTIVWTAIDRSFNASTASQTITVRDGEGPSLTVPADFAVDATMPAGAVVSFVTSAVDNVGVTGVSCTPQSGSIFPLGVTSVRCTAGDAAGNLTRKTFLVTVQGVPAQITALIAFVEGLHLHNGTANPMLNQLRHALRDADSATPNVACKKMNDFKRMLGNHKLSDAPESAVAAMIEDAGQIISALGCR
jgi:hypothetical protein